MKRKLWKKVKSPTKPGSRYGAAGVVRKNEVFILGGTDKDSNVYSDLWCFKIDTSEWIELKSNSPKQESAKGKTPSLVFPFYVGLSPGLLHTLLSPCGLLLFDHTRQQFP